MTRLTATVVFVVLLVAPWQAQTPTIIVDHTSVASFDRIPSQYITAAANRSMMFVDRSVGANIWQGLSVCLTRASDEVAPNFCKQQHVNPQFNSPASDLNWSRPSGYPVSNWLYYGWPGMGIPPALDCPGTEASGPDWVKRIDCFIRYVDAHPMDYQIYAFHLSYLEASDYTDLGSTATGFFARTSRKDVDDIEALQRRRPTRTFVWMTANLGRGTSGQQSMNFNDQMRTYVRSGCGGLRPCALLDVADIESHEPWNGSECYDNRDGVPYTVNGAVQENYPDDHLNTPSICQHYTSEKDGGHLGSASAGMIRIAKAWWVMMARLSGWPG